MQRSGLAPCRRVFGAGWSYVVSPAQAGQRRFYVCRCHAEASHCQRGEPALHVAAEQWLAERIGFHLRLNVQQHL